MTTNPGGNAINFSSVAQALRARGYHPIPCIGKRPAVPGWRHWVFDPEHAAEHDGCNVGIVLGGNFGLVALDIDVMDPDQAAALRAIAERHLGATCPVRVGKAPKALMLFRVSGGPQRKRKHGTIELLGEGQQFVAAGLHPDTHAAYTWPVPLVPAAELPVLSPVELDGLWMSLAGNAPAAGVPKMGAIAPVLGTRPDVGPMPGVPAALFAALCKLNPDERETWVFVGQALKAEANRTGADWPRRAWETWSATSGKWQGWEVEGRIWDSFTADRASVDQVMHAAGMRGLGAEFDVVEVPAGEEVPPTDRPKANGKGGWVLRPLAYGGLESREIPEASFCLDGILPDNVVTLFSAHGGTGKSYIAMMMCVAVAMGLPVLGREPEPRAVLYYSCEEPEAVLLLRLKRICKYYGIRSDDLFASGRLVIHNGFGESNVMFTGQREVENRLTRTYKGLRDLIERERFGLVILDNSSEIYDASEIDRALVRQFIQSLNTFAVLTGGAVMLVAHVDKATTTGENVTGYSGSTAWHNSVRGRWFLSSKGDQLLLQFQKSNYAALAESLLLDWDDEHKVFEVSGTVPRKETRIVNEDEAIQKIAAALAEFHAEDVVVPDTSTSTHNGVAMLARRSGLGRNEVKQALVLMHSRKLIERDDYRKTNRKSGTALKLTDEGRLFSVRPGQVDMLD